MQKAYHQMTDEEKAKYQMICVKCYWVYTPTACGYKRHPRLKEKLMCRPRCEAASFI